MVIEFFCPDDHSALTRSQDGDALVSANGATFAVIDGIPDFVHEADGALAFAAHQDYYRTRAAEYDRGNDVMFQMLLCDELTERNTILDALGDVRGKTILEIGCGTCRDTVHLLNRGADIHAGDLSREMLVIGRQRLRDAEADAGRVRFFRADAMRLPFADGAFDAVFHFGGLNLFANIAGALREMARVVRTGGRVVAGDEGVAPWLMQTDFGKILTNSNALFAHTAPLDRLPVSARHVSCRWVLNGAFYLLAFDVGDGAPALDLDVEFPGWRGGSHRSRYFGSLEGVSPALRDDVIARAAAEGVSIKTWLEQTLRTAIAEKK